MTQSAAIGIMCKAPMPGVTKTRLAAAIGVEQASALSACFLRDVAAAIEALPSELLVKAYGVYAPAGAEDALRRILPPAFDLLLQSDADFGNVLHGAACRLLAGGHDCVLLVNADSPTLPSRLLAQAIDRLREPGDRVVLGPASDGGYYLIGLKVGHRRLFEDIAWGSDDVARRTRERAAEIGLETILLEEWYDIDDAQTFAWLRDELAGRSRRFQGGGAAMATREYIATMSIAAQ
ncbi:MAG: TIGR04282 family arsenosugar biosynthesis glycosyltransferase [Proteobacteria bacterium]|nr:TIGR04282 family arsenosugar biosynthesis glycosyltransferase [Pseudomonadota bacterium]